MPQSFAIAASDRMRSGFTPTRISISATVNVEMLCDFISSGALSATKRSNSDHGLRLGLDGAVSRNFYVADHRRSPAVGFCQGGSLPVQHRLCSAFCIQKVGFTMKVAELAIVKVRNRQAPMKSHLARCRGNLMVDKSTQ